MITNIKEELKKINKVDDDGKLDIFALAKKNNDYINSLFTTVVKEIADDFKIEFITKLLEQWGLTINMGWKKVYWVCENGRVATTYEIAMNRANIERIDYEDALKEVCQLHYELRLNFNKAIKDEELFKYTAFNIGSLGIETFGEFCFYFENATATKLDGLTFIKGNSLDSYSDGKNNLNLDELFKDISTKELINELITIKHKEYIINELEEKEWPSKICNDSCYVEGVVTDELKLELIKCVKIDAEYDEQYTKVALDLRYNEETTTIDRDMLNNYLTAKDKLDKAGIAIKIV